MFDFCLYLDGRLQLLLVGGTGQGASRGPAGGSRGHSDYHSLLFCQRSAARVTSEIPLLWLSRSSFAMGRRGGVINNQHGPFATATTLSGSRHWDGRKGRERKKRKRNRETERLLPLNGL